MIDVIEQVKRDEGYRRYPYRCSAGVLTIGYGRNIDEEHGGEGLSEPESGILLRNNLAAVESDLGQIFPGWAEFGLVRQSALLNMRYQLGPGGFRGFRKMITHINDGRWLQAGWEAMQSKWAVQTPRRAHRVAEEIRDGVALS